MNPLDKEEYSEFLRLTEKTMPFHTEVNARIPYSFQNFPKNFMKESEHLDNIYLNKYLHLIEEIKHRDNKHILPQYMKKYQRKYFLNTGILGHDSFFNNGFESKTKYHMAWTGGILGMGSIANLNVNGADLMVGDTSSNAFSGSANIQCFKVTGGIIGQFYNRIAQNLHSSSTGTGNDRLAFYTDSSGPNTLYQQSAVFDANVGGFTWQSLIEFSLITANNWFAAQNNSGCVTYYNVTAGTNNYSFKAQSFGTFPDPLTGFTGPNNGSPWNLKVGHS